MARSANRIREIRRARGMTLQELAAAIRPEPATAPTIGRFETGARTVSLDWLERIAAALGCSPRDLIEGGENREPPLSGDIDGDGRLTPPVGAIASRSATERSIAARLGDALGPYRAGDVLIAQRLEGGDMVRAEGRDCLVCAADGATLLRKVVLGGREGTFTLVPLAFGPPVRYDVPLLWAAPVTRSIRTIR